MSDTPGTPKAKPERPKDLQAIYEGTLANLDGMTLDAILDARVRYGREEKQAETRKAACDYHLIPLLAEQGAIPGGETYKREGWGSATVQMRETKTISRALLIRKGVDPALIDECTVSTFSEPFVTVYPARGKAEA